MELVSCLSNNEATLMVNRVKEQNEENNDLYSLADICKVIMRFISDKYVAQIPNKFSYNLEHQRKTDLEMRVSGFN
jgi:hypothetical protein